MYWYLDAPQIISKENDREVSDKEIMVAIKFKNFVELSGDQKLEAPS